MGLNPRDGRRKSLNDPPEPAIIAGMSEKIPADVIQMPPTRARLTEIVREIAKSKPPRWSVVTQYDAKADWRRVVNLRQVLLCLEEGYVLEERARLDVHKNWEFQIARVCAGLDVVITCVLEREPAIPRLFVRKIEGVQIIV
jgi:hypothetical protein